MDADRFDTITRSLTETRSRRGALVAVLGLPLGLLGWDGVNDAAAHNALKKCKKKSGKKKKACLKKAKQHNTQHADETPPSPSPPCEPTCNDASPCGPDGCGGSCGTCGGGALCGNAGDGTGRCMCLDEEHVCSTVDGLTICCPDGEVCLITDSVPSCGACPAGSDFCTKSKTQPCGDSTKAGRTCLCTTSIEGTATCTSGAGLCANCTTDAECDTLLNVPGGAVCVSLASCNSGCSETGQKACVVNGCVDGEFCYTNDDCFGDTTCIANKCQ